MSKPPHADALGAARTPLRSVAALSVLAALLFPSTSRAASVYVDRANPACSDAGAGSFLQPTCTIGAAVLRGGPGVTVFVKPGLYRERVVIPTSGTPDAPFTIRAATPGRVVLDGADDMAGTSRWIPHAGDVWLAPSVTVAPKQVFIGDRRLPPSTMTPASLPPMSFTFVSGAGLYVHAGGGNPGLQPIAVGVRTNGFRVTGRSWVEIAGFQVRRCEDKGIYVLSGSHHVTIRGNVVSSCLINGISVGGCSEIEIVDNKSFGHGDHGIALTAAPRSLVLRNESYGNARPTTRAATGIYLFGCSDSRIEGNRAHHNQDSGIECTDGTDRTLSIQNRSWSNGDHGYDRVRCVGGGNFGDVAWGNYKDGFSIEGTSTGVRMANCIAAMNGVGTNEFNLYVDAPSFAGFQSDHNVFSNGAAGAPLKVAGVRYETLAAYVAATGLDPHTTAGDPRFADPAAGNFELLPDSPAIDAADTSVPEWPREDALGRPRANAFWIADAGTGPVAFADRGALEHQPPLEPPVFTVPALVAVDEGDTLRLNVVARDPAGLPLVYLNADLSGLPPGNTATFTTMPGDTMALLTWNTGFADSGTYAVTFVAHGRGSSIATTVIRVNNVDRAPVVSAPATVDGTMGVPLRIALTVSDPDGDPIRTLTADVSQLESATPPLFTVNADRTAATLDCTPTRNGKVTFRASNALATAVTTHVRARRRATAEGTAAEVEEPLVFALGAPAPNPTRAGFALAITAPEGGTLHMALHDLQGRRVWDAQHDVGRGAHTLRWDGRAASGARPAPGLYFLALRSSFAPGVRVERMVIAP